MKYIDINKRYSEIVAEYISKGYTINTSTMSGSQGEVAHIDLTDGTEIIRIMVNSFSDWRNDLEGYEITIGRCTDDVEPNVETWATVWNSRLEVISNERFYKISRYSDYYSTEEDAKTAAATRRYRACLDRKSTPKFEANAKVIEIAKRVIRTQFGYSRVNASEVKIGKRGNKYTITYRDCTHTLR